MNYFRVLNKFVNLFQMSSNSLKHFKRRAYKSKSDSYKKKKRTHLWTANKVKEKYEKLEKQKKKKLKHFKDLYLKYLSSFDLSSPMGRRMLVAFKTQDLESSRVETIVKRYDEHCSTKIRPKTKEPNELCKWKTKRIERLFTEVELSQKDRDVNCFQYSFTRRQRLDRWQRMLTGIEWKSRLVALNCNARVLVNRLTVCPLCSTSVSTDQFCDTCAPLWSSDPYIKDDTNQTQTQTKFQSKRKTTESTKSEAKRKRNCSPEVRPERVCQINLDNEIICVDLSDDE